ncbi:MAG TPA: 3,4-dihydroxy-2-butanone-4-phosphate synthase, partial [Pseudonocardiaceae bacterium]|nr:3,4-dihydroxy-2-butanone-4-phosphate synthase [Pseudonocardiaceae bacterium]
MVLGDDAGEEDAMTYSAFADIDRAIADVASGRPVIVVDDEERENEGDL